MIGLGAILGLLLLASLPAAGAQDQAAVVRSDPALLEIGGGQTVTLNVVLAGAQEVYGIDVRATFDPQLVEVVDADPARAGVQFSPGTFPQPDFLVRNEADNQAGALHYAITQVNPTEPVNGAGVVFSVQLRAKGASGEGSFTISAVDLTDRDGALLAVQPESSVIRITSAGAVTPIALPTATNLPAASPTDPPQAVAPTPSNSPVPASAAPLDQTPSSAPAVTASIAQPANTPSADKGPAAMPTGSAPPSATTTELVPPPEAAAATPPGSAEPASLPATLQPADPAQTSAMVAPAVAHAGGVQPDQAAPEVPSYRQTSSADAGAARSSAADPSRLLLVVGIAALSAAAVLAMLIVVVLRR